MNVPGIKLTKLLDDVQAPKIIDFLSVDVEGHELNVLKTLDFSKYQPQLICLEDNTKGLCSENCKFLNQLGYVYIARTGVNDWYALKKYQNHYLIQRAKACYTKIRWRLKHKLKLALGLEINKSHI